MREDYYSEVKNYNLVCEVEYNVEFKYSIA